MATILAVLGMLATAAVLPYFLALAPDVLDRATLPFFVIVLAQMLQAGVLLFALGWLGLWLGSKIGLGSSLLEALVSKKPWPSSTGRTLLVAVALGLLTGAAILALDRLFSPFMPGVGQIAHPIARWKGLLAAFYGGIVEEAELRLFFMTFVAWLLLRLFPAWRNTVMVTALVIASIAFGVGHLPTAAKVWKLTTAVVTRTIVLNSFGGAVFGALYWKRGFEHAALAHFAADIVLHVVG